ATIQLSKYVFGAGKIITTVGHADKVERAKDLGANLVIVRDPDQPVFSQEIRKLVKAHGLRGIPLVIDHLGADTFRESLRCLAPGGRLVTCGSTTGSEVGLDLKLIFFKNLSILGSTMGARDDLLRMVPLLESGQLPLPVIDSVFPFEGYREAQARLESRNAFGKVVLRVAP
ncbi:MAG: zinc-binding dehydrogenase, partial [Bdellovibrionota bacterium]